MYRCFHISEDCLNPKIKVIGVEPEGANCMQESLKADHVVSLPSVNTIADGTAVQHSWQISCSRIFKANVDEIITVPDARADRCIS